jgi:cysteine desulfurase
VIYLDNAATTRLRPEALERMLPYLQNEYGNASGGYALARSAHGALDTAREQMRSALHALKTREIFFTSGGTESDNWAMKGVAYANRGKGRHIITSAVEHHAVLETCAFLEKEGFEVTYLLPDAEGIISAEAVRQAVRPDTILISIMWANNEMGAINPIAEIGAFARQKGICFHTDAVQAAGHLPIDVQQANVDLLSVSAHKFHGPKGIGVLYVREGIRLIDFMDGGAQERGKRAGTENVAAIAGMGLAMELAIQELPQEADRICALREHMIERILKEIPGAQINGSRSRRLPGNVNVSLPGVRSEVVLFKMDMAGIACSGGSACTAGAIGRSHVLTAMGLEEARIAEAIRFSFGRYTTLEEVDTAVDCLKTIAFLKK